jgi:hypothetical protein
VCGQRRAYPCQRTARCFPTRHTYPLWWRGRLDPIMVVARLPIHRAHRPSQHGMEPGRSRHGGLALHHRFCHPFLDSSAMLPGCYTTWNGALEKVGTGIVLGVFAATRLSDTYSMTLGKSLLLGRVCSSYCYHFVWQIRSSYHSCHFE